MPKGFHVVCLEPGADNPKSMSRYRHPSHRRFIDNTVKVFRSTRREQGRVLGTMPAFPEAGMTRLSGK